MNESDLMYWINSSKGIEKEIVADYLYENNRTHESEIIRSMGKVEQGQYVENKLIHKVPLAARSSTLGISDRGVGSGIYGEDQMKEIKKISFGRRYSMFLKNNGKVIVTGARLECPYNLENVIDVYTRLDTCMALTEDKTLYKWGDKREKWRNYSNDIECILDYQQSRMAARENLKNIKHVAVNGDQTIVLNDENEIVIFNSVETLYKTKFKKDISKVSISDNGHYALYKDGTVLWNQLVLGSIHNIENGLVDIIDIKSCVHNTIALDKNGNVIRVSPMQHDSILLKNAFYIAQGFYHYAALTLNK